MEVRLSTWVQRKSWKILMHKTKYSYLHFSRVISFPSFLKILGFANVDIKSLSSRWEIHIEMFLCNWYLRYPFLLLYYKLLFDWIIQWFSYGQIIWPIFGSVSLCKRSSRCGEFSISFSFVLAFIFDSTIPQWYNHI